VISIKTRRQPPQALLDPLALFGYDSTVHREFGGPNVTEGGSRLEKRDVEWRLAP
jgi:hypothetical protein